MRQGLDTGGIHDAGHFAQKHAVFTFYFEISVFKLLFLLGSALGDSEGQRSGGVYARLDCAEALIVKGLHVFFPATLQQLIA
jgi:hypothetical protein